MERDVNKLKSHSQLEVPTLVLPGKMFTAVNTNTHCHANCEGVDVGDSKSRKTRVRYFFRFPV